jgi:hypothetical protein
MTDPKQAAEQLALAVWDFLAEYHNDPGSFRSLSVIVDNAVGEDADVQQNHHYTGEMDSRFNSHRVFESFRTRK